MKMKIIKIKILFALSALLLIAGAVLINGIAAELTGRYNLRADLTANSVYDISDGTKEFLATLDASTDIYVLSSEEDFPRTGYLDQARRIINLYPRYSGNISLRYIDYAADPSFAANYPELPLSHGDIVVQSGGKVKHLPAANLFNYTYTADGGLAVSSSRAEEALTSAIIGVTSGKNVRIAVLTGNGVSEAPLLTTLLASNSYELEPAALTTAELGGYDMALLLAPASDLSEDVVRKLEEFLYNGGDYGKTLFYTASPVQGAMPVLDAFLSEWGVAFSDGAVFETVPDKTYQYQPFYPLVGYEEGKYTDMLKDKTTPFLMPLARPMQTLFTVKDGYYAETLLSFGGSSGVRPADAGDDFTAADSPVNGPMPALVLSSFSALTAGENALSSHILISSSTGIFDAIALQNTSLTNSEYILNVIAGLTERADGVRVEPKALAGKTLGVTSGQASLLGVLLTGGLPGVILLAGIAVWVSRRYK